jgi:hypothetical protein
VCPITMFPPANAAEMHLERCVRVYPHLQVPGGREEGREEERKGGKERESTILSTPTSRCPRRERAPRAPRI